MTTRLPFLKSFQEIIWRFKKWSLRSLVFGKKTFITGREKELLKKLRSNFSAFRSQGARRGKFLRINMFHKAKGLCFLTVNTIGHSKKESVLVFDEKVKITPGVDLFVYLSVNRNVKKQGLGETLVVGHLRGTRGGQTYIIKKPLAKLQAYQSVVILSRQFDVLFSYAPLQ